MWDYSDLLEVLRKGHLLVVVDYYFKWPEVAFLSMESMFCTHGLSETLWSNNGPPFASQEFEGFHEYLAVDLKKGIPYWPQSDGEVERLNKTLLKAIRIAELEGKDWKQELQDQYCNTPHTVAYGKEAETPLTDHACKARCKYYCRKGMHAERWERRNMQIKRGIHLQVT